MSGNSSRISQAIRGLRKDSGLTQVEFAAALKVAPTSIHRWEAGSGVPEFEMVVALWSLAIERGSSTSREFADFLISRTDAIKPLFDAKALPEIKALDSEITSLPVEQRQLALAFVRMLKQNTDQVTDRIIRTILEPWMQSGGNVRSQQVSPRKASSAAVQKKK